MSNTVTAQSSSRSLNKVLSEHSINVLRTRGDTSQLHHGFRAVSNTSYSSKDSFGSQATVQIPDELDSVETLRFLELNDATARRLWDRYCSDVAEFPQFADLFGLARRWIREATENAMWEGDDWVGIMQRMGLSNYFQARLMDESFKDIRLSGSVKEWTIEMMEIRYEFLMHLDNVIKAPPARNVQRKVSKMDIDGKIKLLSGPEIPARSTSKTLQTGTSSASQPSTATQLAEPPQELDAHTMFFKSGAMSRLESVYTKPNELFFEKICTIPPGDFSSRIAGLYLTKNEQVAWQYAQWRRQLADGNVVPLEFLGLRFPIACSRPPLRCLEINGEVWFGPVAEVNEYLRSWLICRATNGLLDPCAVKVPNRWKN